MLWQYKFSSLLQSVVLLNIKIILVRFDAFQICKHHQPWSNIICIENVNAVTKYVIAIASVSGVTLK